MEITCYSIDAGQPNDITPNLKFYIIDFCPFQSIQSIVDIQNKSVKCLKLTKVPKIIDYAEGMHIKF